jgi:hypothetical protein
MAKTLITTPYPEPADVARKLGITPARFRELEAMMEEIMAENDRRAARAKARKKRSQQAMRKGNVAARKKR